MTTVWLINGGSWWTDTLSRACNSSVWAWILQGNTLMETTTEWTKTVTLCHNWYISLYIWQDGWAFHSSCLDVETCRDSRCHFFCNTVLANFVIVPEDLKQTSVHETLSLSLQLFSMLGDHHSPCVCTKSLLPEQELKLLNPQFPWGI